MNKEVIRLTEEELKNLINESVQSVLNEIGYRGAALPYGANYNANNQIYHNINVSHNMNKINKSQEITLPALNQSIIDNFPNLHLQFRECIMRLWCTLSFDFSEITYINDKRFVMKGSLCTANKDTHNGYIEYNFSKGCFYEVKFYGKGTIRRMYEIIEETAIPENKILTDNFHSFISNYLYSIEDFYTNVNTNQ